MSAEMRGQDWLDDIRSVASRNDLIDWVDLHLVDAEAAAVLLGLKHRNSVYTYHRRYEGFPDPIVAGHWLLADIVAWIESRRVIPGTDA